MKIRAIFDDKGPPTTFKPGENRPRPPRPGDGDNDGVRGPRARPAGRRVSQRRPHPHQPRLLREFPDRSVIPPASLSTSKLPTHPHIHSRPAARCELFPSPHRIPPTSMSRQRLDGGWLAPLGRSVGSFVDWRLDPPPQDL